MSSPRRERIFTSRWPPAAGRWGRKVVRYSLVSVVSITVSQSILMVAFGMLHWSARLSNIVACAVATVPSYYLNRTWAWGRRGRSHLWREVLPFWALAFLGLAFSTWAADFGSTLAQRAAISHQATTMTVMVFALAAFGVLWVGKFAIFNAVLFAESPPRVHGPGHQSAGDVVGAGRSVRVFVVAATAGLLLVGSASLWTAKAQEPPPDPTTPPTSEPATTATPPTSEPATTAPPTTEPVTTQPPTTQPPTTVTATQPTTTPSTTAGVEAGGATTPPGGAGGTSPTVSPSVGGPGHPSGSIVGGSSETVRGAPAAGPSDPQQLGSPRSPQPSAVWPQRALRELLDGAPAQLPRRVVQEATQALRQLSPAELGLFLLLALLSLVLTAIAGTTLWWMLHAWRTPQTLAATGFSGSAADPRLSFSLIVPARHEQAVLGATLSRLAAIDHPAFEVLVVVGDDDPQTAVVAHRAARRHPDRVRVLVDDNRPKNKPKALNTALPACRGDVIGVFDAEDEVHPQLLRHIDARFAETKADVVQGGVQLMNYQSSWYAVRNVLEYYFWFRSRLHFHAKQRFIPLGGNTVFVRAELLRQAGGWDPDCLAEDCELGVRLSSMGATVAVAYDPELVTREETPDSLKAFLKQRTRWNQGFLQVLRKGEWRRLPTARQRMLARYTLAMPFLQAFIGPLVPLSLAAVLLLKAPVLAALISFLPLTPTLVVVVVEMVGLGEFCRAYGFRPRLRDYRRLVVGTAFYHLLLAAAAFRAVLRELRGRRGWEKTAHVGAHRTPAADRPAPISWTRTTDRSA